MDTERVMEYLAREGFRPTVPTDREVRFNFEGDHYYVRVAPDDDQYVAIGYPTFWQLGSPEETVRALRAANEAAERIKVVKVLVIEAQHNVWAEVELLVDCPEAFEALFTRTLSILRFGAEQFAESMRKSELLPDKCITLKREEITRWTNGN